MTEFRGRQRKIMAPNRYTELFFLDEVTALAAGHRPCFECRNGRAKSFAAAFPGEPMPADNIDLVLHRERCVSGAPQPLIDGKAIEALPVGAMIATRNTCFAIAADRLLEWGFSGYRAVGRNEATGIFALEAVKLLTPQSTVEALRNGYRPTFHHSAHA
ncbi:MAG: hypothetical protein AAF724_00695 [Pseudomonadota bacterium]